MYYKEIYITDRISIIIRSWTIYEIVAVICSLLAILSCKYGSNLIALLFIIISLIYDIHNRRNAF